MKKILLGSSAVALAGASATSANAAKWDVDVGGFFNAWAVYTSEDDALVGSGGDGFDILTNAEIIFTPTITLDNGITFGAKVEMEAEADAAGGSGQSGAIDESVLFIEGSFGRVELGAEDSAYGTMGVCSPTNGPAGVCSGTLTGTFLAGNYGAFAGPAGGGGFAGQIAGDAVRINYYTPRFSGFQVGVSYARGASKNDRFFENRNTSLSDIFSIGANYEGNFGDVSLKVAGTYETADAPAGGGSDPDQFHLGAKVGFGGIEIGGGYARYEAGSAETDFFDLGIGYSTGPWGVSLGGSLTDHDSFGETTQVALNGQYKLGPGVKAVAYVGWAEFDADGGGSVDGFSVGTGIHLGF
eukprot:gb/GEZJ01006499.1/.p1 GENE.gb/GEZJ01006499.1/~~gb/GEZJ01006499.1/.p1  ORF type:complete len:355 (-),score=32.89 gb/GEZJ01006499.1/:76-1140(-)